MAGPMKLRALRSVNPRLDLAYADRLRCMYKGGRALLRNPRVLEDVFPRHPLESAANYAVRCQRAFYDQDMAIAIGQILAGLAQDPIHFDDGGASVGKDAEPLPEYWANLQQDARAPGDGGAKKTFAEKIEQSIQEAVICGMGWMLCDLPRPPTAPDGTSLITSRADEERWQADRAYPVPYRVDQVPDWGEDDDGTLQWVKTCTARDAAAGPGGERGVYTTYTWRIWDAETISVYQLTLDRDDKDPSQAKWEPDSVVPVLDEVPHTFGVVPWVCFDADVEDEPTLWLADQLESRCRQIMGANNRDDHLNTIGSYPQLYEFLGAEAGGPDQIIPENQSNPWRATRSMALRGPDVIQVRGSGDTASFVEPTMAAHAANRESVQEGRDQIPRIVGMLALQNDTSGAMIRRSGESKQQDAKKSQIVMAAIGRRGRAFANAVKEMLARGRGEDISKLPALKGYENFDVDDASSIVDEHVALANAPVKSATFEIERQVKVAKAVLGSDTPPETMALIRDELESSITQEQFDEPAVQQMEQQDQRRDNGNDDDQVRDELT